MLLILGSLIVLASVAGGYVLSHGNLIALWQPYELLVIGGAAFGAFVTANQGKTIKAVFKAVPGVLKGSKYNKTLYLDMLGLMYDLFSKARKEGMMAIEDDIEEPENSEIFKNHGKVAGDHHAVEFIADYMRLIVSGSMNPFEMEALMDLELETHHHEAEAPSQALTKMSDGLPGFGIVAAVLGIVITMGSLGGPVEEIGGHVAAALVGTFLGILLAYGFVAPTATAMENLANEEHKFLQVIKTCIMASLNGYTPQVAVEFGRKAMYASIRPGFKELEDFVKGK